MINVLGAYFRTARVQIAASLYVIIAALLTQLPLFNYLGYEFSAVMTIPAALISGILTLQFLAEHRRKPITRRTWLYVIGDYLHVNFLLLLLPLIIISLNALVVKNCAYGKGAAFFVLMPMVTMIFSVSLALVIGSLFIRAKTVFVAAVLIILLHIVYVTYTKQQLFAYNLILGFFPGITYDETVGNVKVLVLFREFTIICSLMLVLLFVLGLGHWNPVRSLRTNVKELSKTFRGNRIVWSCIVVAGSALVYGYLNRSDLGFEHSAADIQERLGRRSESDHFIFYYSADDYTMSELIRLRKEAEHNFRIAAGRLQIHDTGRKIEVYIYPSAETKRQLIGTLNTNIAKPWKREIHISSATFDGSFRHELVHVLAAEFGFPVIRASTRMGLNEGLATAVDWETGLFTPHHYSAALLRENALDNVASLFTLTGFASRPGAFAYTVTGSFCRYLIDRFGIDRVKRAFANGNFIIAFNETAESLIRDWKAFLKTVDISLLPPETVRVYFFQPSIFYKECAREVAEKNQRAVEAVRVRDFAAAERQFSASYDDAPTAYALRGMMQSLIAQKKFHEAISWFDRVPENSLLKINPILMYLYADAHLFTGQVRTASALYERIAGMNSSEPMIESALLRKLLVEEQIGGNAIHILFYGEAGDTAKGAAVKKMLELYPRSAALCFLDGMMESRLSQWDEALQAFRRVLDGTAPQGMKYFASVHSAGIEYRQEQYERAKHYFWIARDNALTPAIHDFLDEKIELCDAVSTE